MLGCDGISRCPRHGVFEAQTCQAVVVRDGTVARGDPMLCCPGVGGCLGLGASAERVCERLGERDDGN